MDITDIADISMDIADIGTDIADIATGIADVVNSADIADRMLRTLRWKQVDAYKVSRGCPVTAFSIVYYCTKASVKDYYIIVICSLTRAIIINIADLSSFAILRVVVLI